MRARVSLRFCVHVYVRARALVSVCVCVVGVQRALHAHTCARATVQYVVYFLAFYVHPDRRIFDRKANDVLSIPQEFAGSAPRCTVALLRASSSTLRC